MLSKLIVLSVLARILHNAVYAIVAASIAALIAVTGLAFVMILLAAAG